jgi:antitoxin component YwqK of YwqJK toxin-antitoxin module
MKNRITYLFGVATFLLISCSKTPESGSKSDVPATTQQTPAPKADAIVVDWKTLEKRSDILYAIGAAEPFTGVAIERFPNGVIGSRFTYRNGIPHGPGATFYDDGKKESEAMQANGFVHGPVTEWHQNGNKRLEVTYINGKKHGLQIEYWENGNRRHEETYVDGVLSGPAADYDKEGTLSQKYHMNG